MDPRMMELRNKLANYSTSVTPEKLEFTFIGNKRKR